MANEKILVVDDELEIRRTLAMILADVGYQITEARNGQEACEKVIQKVPDLVLLDYKLPDMSGGEVLNFIKKKNPELAVLIISGYGSKEQAEELIAAGARGFVDKPFEFEQLLEEIRKALS